MAGCLISARLWLLGLDARQRPLWRHDATIRVDGGMVAQIGAFPAVAYGLDRLRRFGDGRAFALPLFAPPSSLAARFAGAGGSLTPGSPAHVALFAPDGPTPTRAALRAWACAPDRDAPGVLVFLDGRPAFESDALTPWRRTLEGRETPEEAALWAAAATARV